MKRIYLSPLMSLSIIAIVAIGAGWLIVSTAKKASALVDDYSAVEPTSQAVISAHKKSVNENASTQDPSLGTQQVQ